MNAETIASLPQLKYIGVTATGYNVVDIEAARAAGIVVTNVPAYSTRSVAQHAFALLLELTNHVGLHSDAVRAGDWASSIDWCFTRASITELDGLTLGIVGWGRIGQATAEIGRAFGMNVIATTRSARQAEQVEFVQMNDLFRRADVISLHCPLTPETNQFINAGRLALMKPSAFLINTGRGPLIDEAALAQALNDDRLAGAALDVLSTEPPAADNPLLAARNCVITPHNAWASRSARSRLLHITVENLRAFLAGKPQNVVS